jgi:protein-L-isoaspartate(D-aspartate) O-methyltransferase
VASAATLRRRLVRELDVLGLLEDERVRDAFLAVPRERFVPEVSAEVAYRNEAILTKQTEGGHGLSSSSQPSIMAIMLGKLQLEPGHRVLEIGAGTGYNAALLKHLVGEQGRVTTVDIDAETAGRARRALNGRRVKVVTADGRVGYPAGAPYDRIIVTASHDEVPRAWRDQLRPGGLVEAPLRLRGSDSLQLIPTLRREGDRLRSVSVVVGGFMPLRAASRDLTPYWPTLNASRFEGAKPAPLLSIYGEAVRTLRPAAARRLLGAALSEPRSRRLRVRPSWDSFGVFFAATAPTPRLVGVMTEKDFSAGLISRDGRSLAILAGWRPITRILSFGTEEAADELEQMIEVWKARGRPGIGDIRMSVSFSNGRSQVRMNFRGR